MKSLKFLVLGAVATGLLATSAMAANTNEEVLKDKISTEITQLIQEQQDKGFLKEKAIIEFKIISSNKKFNPETNTYEEITVLTENEAQMINKQCKVLLAYDKDGNSPSLSHTKEIKEVTQLKNETQKKMLREFVALHENFHCEFANIKNPVNLEGQSHNFNQKMNDYFKELNNLNNLTQEKTSDYLTTLNENFADVSATGILLKKYGKDNAELKYVLKVIETQRHGEYLSRSQSNHFTHLGLNNAMSDNYLNKLTNANNENFNEVALNIANKSTQQLMVDKSEIAEMMTSSSSLPLGVMMTVVQQIGNKISSNDKTNQLNNEQSTGMFEKIAIEAVKGEDIKSNLKIGKSQTEIENINIEKVIDYSSRLLAKKNVATFMEVEIKQFNEYMTNFKSEVYQQHKTEQENATKKISSCNNIFDLRAKFLASNTKDKSLKIGK